MRMLLSSRDRRFLLLKIISPEVTRQLFSSSLIIERAVRDFPLPDSPINERISDSFKEKFIFFRISDSLSEDIDRQRLFIFNSSLNFFILFYRMRIFIA